MLQADREFEKEKLQIDREFELKMLELQAKFQDSSLTSLTLVPGKKFDFLKLMTCFDSVSDNSIYLKNKLL